ncbi:DDB1- and CUL4-associated factor 7 [Marchantia polymorpha subsp. ruderalis]|uniref:Uncharacterized protein n=2 Tax=Marchantia polymorpha TaxID=3197 RepID=A0A176WN38_MARPO|nr:hypothetical protein AXG93_1299s1010 [Marchantia polymorpha subsp. ruderalis]PTQ42869.1 hypothetical protein MARPO_0027s0005 [Marchantia polymorpha]BBN10765.1 hypothetical protein Mp_5g06230 [Marchantia polymorpha subsp. ruderalis]|eukprot:PTQ42869.1 hypothetical protein MARPO_0027s0005 [Marchantia polymorpha]
MSNRNRTNNHESGRSSSRKTTFTYDAPWPIYALNWTIRRDKRFRLGIGSYLEESRNRVDIIQFDEKTDEFVADPNLTIEHPYPVTKLMFVPDKEGTKPDLLATTGDHLRIWQIYEDEVRLKSLLKTKEDSEFCAPLTSFDWNASEPNRLGTAGVDAMVTIWDVEKEAMELQMLAHDKEVFDIAWGSVGEFASVSADGSIRLFDLRDKKHSTIIYESPQPDTPLLRLAWSKHSPNYMATVVMDSNKIMVLDTRYSTIPVFDLQRHQASVNTIGWATHSPSLLCSGGDDSEVFLWDLQTMSEPVDGGFDPILAYSADSGVNNLQWSSMAEWVAIVFSSELQLLRI